MPSYLVTGANRGIGLALVRQLSENKANTVVGLVRNKANVNADSVGDLTSRENLHWVQGDLENRASLDAAVSDVSAITGGKLDVLIANAGLVVQWSGLDGITELVKEDPARTEEELLACLRVNVIGQIFLFIAFLPLIKAGSLKKVVGISTGLAVTELTADHAIYQNPLYSISKAAFDMAIAKLHAEHKNNGILFMSVSPGVVDTGSFADPADSTVGPKMLRFMQTLAAYAPEFKGPITPDESAKRVLGVVEQATIEANGGKIVSHFGNKQWL